MKQKFHRTNHSRCKQVLRKIKKWGQHLLLAAAFSVTPMTVVSCAETNTSEQQERPQELSSTGIWAEPYSGEITSDENGNYYMSERFLLKVRDSVDQGEVDALIREVDGRLTAHIPQINTYEVEVHGCIDQAISRLNENDSIESAFRNYFFEAAYDNDQYIENGDSPPELSTYSNAVELEKGVWWSTQINLSNGLTLIENSEIALNQTTIAVIDVGFTHHHPNAEIPYHTGGHQWDFAEWDSEVFEACNHGEDVSSFIAAINNNFGLNGVAATLNSDIFSILPLKTLSGDTLTFAIEHFGVTLLGDDLRISAAIIYAADQSSNLNIEAINISMGLSFPIVRGTDYAFESAMLFAHSNGIITVVAAGNSNGPINLIRPASSFGVIPVTGTALVNHTEIRYPNSSFSLLTADTMISAPAQDLLCFDAEGNPSLTSGTSFASPQVAGLVALIRSINPDKNYLDVLQLILETSDSIILDDDPNLLVRGQSWNRINVYNTISRLLDEVEPFVECQRLNGASGGFNDFDGTHILYHSRSFGSSTTTTFNVNTGEEIFFNGMNYNPRISDDYVASGFEAHNIISGAEIDFRDQALSTIQDVYDDIRDIESSDWDIDANKIFIVGQITRGNYSSPRFFEYMGFFDLESMDFRLIDYPIDSEEWETSIPPRFHGSRVVYSFLEQAFGSSHYSDLYAFNTTNDEWQFLANHFDHNTEPSSSVGSFEISDDFLVYSRSVESYGDPEHMYYAYNFQTETTTTIDFEGERGILDVSGRKLAFVTFQGSIINVVDLDSGEIQNIYSDDEIEDIAFEDSILIYSHPNSEVYACFIE